MILATSQLASTSTLVRLSLHVLAACVWVGGQIVLAGLVPTLRSLGEEAPRKVARAFGRLSWPAYWLLIVTGFWNYAAVHGSTESSSWNTAFAVKMLMVVVAGIGAFLHTRAATPRARGLFAGVGPLATLFAMIIGGLLAGECKRYTTALVSAAPTTTTGNGARAISAASAVPTSAIRWSSTRWVLAARDCVTTNELSSATGTSALIRWSR